MRSFSKAAACGALVLGGAAAAQVMPEVKVTASRDAAPSLTVPGVESATKAIERRPGGVSVLDMRQREAAKVTNLTDALGDAPGVFVQSRFGQDESRLSIRGSGLQRTFHLRGVKLLQDGVQLNQADGSADFQATDPLMPRYVVVERGANALRYGATTLGGAVDFISPTGYDLAAGAGRRGSQARAEAGSHGFGRLQAQTGGVSDGTDFALGLTHYREDGFREHSNTMATRFSGNVGFRPTESLESRWFLGAVDSDSELPGTLTKAQLAATPRMANPTNLAQNQQRNLRLHRLANRTTYTLFADPYALWGLRAAGPLDRSVSWWLDARNLSDRRYAASTGVIADAGGADRAQFLPGNGRSLYAGLRAAF
jgi:iron complex outermembrane receptor protein